MTKRPLALITGGWRRVGAAIARKLAGEGWDLALHAHRAASFDPAFAAELEALGAHVFALEAELSDPARAPHLPAEAAAMAGRAPSLLVNCASAFAEDTIATVTAENLEQHFGVNLFAPVLLSRAMAEVLGEASGSIIHVLDQRVVNPVPDQLSYTLSKQALHAAVRTLSRAMAPRLRVNGVAPGLTLPTADYDEAQWQRLAALMPLGYLPEPQDIAGAVAYLAGARSVTGQTIFVDGGAHLESYARDFVYLAK